MPMIKFGGKEGLILLWLVARDLVLSAHGDEGVHACAAFLALTPFDNCPHELTACRYH